eukprot:5550737-Pyramimonas_sp.AAC.1
MVPCPTRERPGSSPGRSSDAKPGVNGDSQTAPYCSMPVSRPRGVSPALGWAASSASALVQGSEQDRKQLPPSFLPPPRAL